MKKVVLAMVLSERETIAEPGRRCKYRFDDRFEAVRDDGRLDRLNAALTAPHRG